jgi:hypothetical protein
LPVAGEDAGDGVEVGGNAFIAGMGIEKAVAKEGTREVGDIDESLAGEGLCTPNAADEDEDDFVPRADSSGLLSGLRFELRQQSAGDEQTGGAEKVALATV